jgi:hypothetical protein
MREDEVQSPISLETLVRADLDRRADAIDTQALFDRIRHASVPVPLRLPTSRRVIRWFSGISAAAAAVLIVFLLSQGSAPAQASPRELLLEARRQLQVPRDRCYLVEMRKESELLEQEDSRPPRGGAATQTTRIPLLQQSRMTLLWTRGDQFWMTPINAPQPFAWGRGKAGDYWISLGPWRGVQYAANEVPPLLQHTADILSMQVDRLLDDVLRDFDVVRLSPTDPQPATTVTIQATLKPGHRHPALRGARIEFDEQTKVVRKLVLERTRFGVHVATVTYLLVDTEPREDRSYELTGHLEPQHELLDARNDPGGRWMLLRRFFDPGMVEPPIRPMNPNQPMNPMNPMNPRSPGMRPPLPLPPTTRPETRERI